jgi:hypothetical protein
LSLEDETAQAVSSMIDQYGGYIGPHDDNWPRRMAQDITRAVLRVWRAPWCPHDEVPAECEECTRELEELIETNDGNK